MLVRPVVLLAIVLFAYPALSQEKALRNEYYTISLNVRARMELAKQEGLDRGRANTIRTLLGLETVPLHGLSVTIQGENNTAFNDDRYWDTVSTPNGKTAIADPGHMSLNQLFGRYQNDGLLGLDARGGRQRITLDDQRFVGDVGWRQNMQTFDSAWVQSHLGVEGLRASFGYLWDIRRIFGDKGSAAQKDWDSNSYLYHVAYDGFAGVDASAFAYLLDFDNSLVNSANSYGFRATGRRQLSGTWSLPWATSYAYQTDAGDNPVDYRAHYVNAELGATLEGWGTLKGGYELLGSDDGKARFVTPLATAHKFNGYADAFLDNGGLGGLQDLYFTLAPKLPSKLKGHVTYHRFWSDDGSDELGEEWDVVLSRPLTSYLVGLTKVALFNGTPPGPADRWRFTLEFTFRY
jgi:hypothetical protein